MDLLCLPFAQCCVIPSQREPLGFVTAVGKPFYAGFLTKKDPVLPVFLGNRFALFPITT